ncbi:hypothetical protein TTHERM_000418599 (macronuclear) [Tetrahymena thermophila SB210]|uniref:Uncharacterized protein n=1 Tax=Tetrahymena thermophila (strain SB210) TaxID=312017 RepID=W7XH95_TETTS|nr:hypothetical protein TTHERM_000418599 [Tetrahymena thermophila SB210]EWS76563.1 hypothetical protein TTHERM_000418599 [Tetrahymena thermophila SB210]|eukprot:XP_012650849.1 hypothetical protein TTHERM_000418599 [Tetrahymena thermophila SB210]
MKGIQKQKLMTKKTELSYCKILQRKIYKLQLAIVSKKLRIWCLFLWYLSIAI